MTTKGWTDKQRADLSRVMGFDDGRADNAQGKRNRRFVVAGRDWENFPLPAFNPAYCEGYKAGYDSKGPMRRTI